MKLKYFIFLYEDSNIDINHIKNIYLTCSMTKVAQHKHAAIIMRAPLTDI